MTGQHTSFAPRKWRRLRIKELETFIRLQDSHVQQVVTSHLIDFLHYRGGALLEYCFLAGQAPGALGRHAQWSTAEAARTIAW